jgi:hypothetical protein
MNTEQCLKRDERTVTVENAGFKWGYYCLALGLVIDAVYRQEVRNEAIGDLIALLCVSSAISLVYLVAHKAWVPRWPLRRVVLVLAGCIVVAVLVFVLTILSILLFP